MSIVKDTLIEEMKMLIANAIKLKKQITTAKTKTKSNYLTKKLHKNNHDAAEVVAALESIIKIPESQLSDNDEVPTEIVKIAEGIQQCDENRPANEPTNT